MAREAARPYHGTAAEVEAGRVYQEGGAGFGATTQAGSRSDWISELREMKALVEENILTEEEFTRMKSELLDRVGK